MKLATRFYLAVAAVLAAAFVIGWLAVGPDEAGLRTAALVLLGLLVAFVPVTRFVAGRVGSRLDDALREVSLARDLREELTTARRESEDFRALFDGLEDGLAFIDDEGLVQLFNPAFESWAGRPVTRGDRIGSLFRAPPILEAVGKARKGVPTVEEFGLGDRTVLLSARPHRSGGLVALRDVTAMRRLEATRRDFVANVSHELKTPLTSVMGFAEALSEGVADPEGARDFAGRIVANADRMQRLVEDLLDLARVESGSWTPKPESIPVGVVVREVWDAMTSRSGSPSPSLVVSTDETHAYADPDAFRQILRNLLDNAAGYSQNGSQIDVLSHAEGAFLQIEVRDRGPGIPSGHLDRVFERFYRVDPARSRERGGTGLGLAIVKHLVEAHGGNVAIDSELGRGTTVKLSLPLDRPVSEDGSARTT